MKTLEGVRIVNTRPKDQAAELSVLLRGLGADVLEFPTIRIAPPDDREPLQKSTRQIKNYDWVVLTSVNGVNAFMDAIYDSGHKASAFEHVKICAVGTATAEQLHSMGVQVDLVPDENSSVSLADALKNYKNISGKKFLLPRSDIARSELPEQLRSAGAVVHEVIAYQTVPEDVSEEKIGELFKPRLADVITFTSSSTAKNFASILGFDRLHMLIGETLFASIGPQTSRTMRDLTIPVGIEADPYDIPGLVDVISKKFK